MAKNSYKANVNQYANQEEAIRKAKDNPNKNIHSKKKNSNYGGYTTGAYMAQKVAEKVNQQEKVKLPTWLNVTLIAEFAVVLVILILRLTAFKDSAVMTHLSSLTLGITCGTLFYIRKYKHTKKTSAMYSIITILLGCLCLCYPTCGSRGMMGFCGGAPRAVRRRLPGGRKEPSYG